MSNASKKVSKVSEKACAEDPRIIVAVNTKIEFDRESRTLSIPEAMKLADFLPTEARDRTLQARVRRLYDVKKPKTVPKVVGGAANERPAAANDRRRSNAEADDVSPLTPASSIVRNLYPSSSSSTKRSRSSSSGASSRRSAKDIRKADTEKQRHDEKKSLAVKFATRMCQEQRESGGRTSAQACADAANKMYGTNISRKMVSEYVNNGRAGESPLCMGPKAPLGIPHRTEKVLSQALESFIRINQQNGVNTFNLRPNMQTVLRATVLPLVTLSTYNLLDRCTSQFTLDTGVALKDSVEERRIRWTTYQNLSTWFDSWESDLEELGFGSKLNGEFVIPPTQLRRTLNIDETAMSLDGSNLNKGGRPPTQHCDISLPNPGTATTKSSACITAICGSTAAGEAVPVHLQFATKSADDRRVLQFETFKHLPRIRGTFGHRHEKLFPCTVGMNEKGGMDSEQFANCIIACIAPLCPDVANVKGKRVMIKVDSGPGRNNIELMTRLRYMGFCFYATVPNTTAVCQETDQSCSCFKGLHYENLKSMTFDRITCGKPPTTNVNLIGVLIFGGADPATGLCSCKPAFDLAFTKERNLRMWSKVGAAPLTRACLNHHLARHTNADDDPLCDILNNIAAQNDVACTVLTARGLNGNKLRVALKRAPKRPGTVTVKNSVEQMEALAKAGTAGARFNVAGSGHATSDAAFTSAEESARNAKVKAMEMDKKKRNSACDIIQRALKIQESLENCTVDELSVADVALLLRWCGMKTTAVGKLKKQEKVAKLKKIREENKTSPLTAKPWTQAEEDELRRLVALKGNIKMGDTETGRHDAVKKGELKAAALDLSMEERQEIINMWKEKDASAVASVEETTASAASAP